MATDNLDGFLDAEEPGQAEAEPLSAAVETPEAPLAAEPREPTAPVVEPEKDDDPEVPPDVAGLRSALQAERGKRNDYKGERDRLAGEMAALKVQLEAAQKPPPAPVAAPVPEQRAEPVAIPNPVEDPVGYHAFIQRDMFNRSLNMSEIMLRQSVGDDADVDAKVAKFKELAAANPALRAELQKQPHPYKYVYDYAKRSMAMDEIGPDPQAYRTKLEAEIRAQVQAEMAGTVQAPARIQLPQSLGTARSAAPRSNAVINVPEAFDDILNVRR